MASIRERLEQVQQQRVGRLQLGIDGGVHQRGEHDRPPAVAAAGLGDLLHRLAGLLGAVHERNAQLAIAQRLELGHHAVSQRLGRNAGAVGHEEHGALGRAVAVGHGELQDLLRCIGKLRAILA